MIKKIKTKMKTLFQKAKSHLPLIGTIALVSSIVLGLFCLTRCAEKKEILTASANEVAPSFDDVFNNTLDDSIESAVRLHSPCNLFAKNGSVTAFDKYSNVSVTLSGDYIDTVVYSNSSPASYCKMINLCANSYCPLDYENYAVSFWVDSGVNVDFYIYNGFEYVPMTSTIIPDLNGVSRKYWGAPFLWTGEEVLSVVGFSGGSLTLHDLNVVYRPDALYNSLPILDSVSSAMVDWLSVPVYMICQEYYELGLHNCATTHQALIDYAYEQGLYDGYGKGWDDCASNFAMTWECPDCDDEYLKGYDNGYADGNLFGYDKGYDAGVDDTYDIVYEDIREEVENEVLSGKDDFLDLIYSIFDAPVRIVRTAFDFELFGINISELILFAITAIISIVVIKKLKGGL